MIGVTVNGESREVPEGTCVDRLLADMGFDPARVAVEIGGRICPKAGFGSRELADGDRLEVVSFVGGG